MRLKDFDFRKWDEDLKRNFYILWTLTIGLGLLTILMYHFN